LTLPENPGFDEPGKESDMKHLAFVVIMVMIAIPAMAGVPVPGTYLSYDMPGGSFNTGRFTESWVGTGADGQIGNTANAQSWNGVALGLEWKLWCPSIQTAPVLVSDTRDGNGTGEVTWRTVYSGGHFFLGAAGPWGDEDYGGDLANFIVTATYQFVFGNLLGIRSNVVSWGQIDGYTDCMEYEINNAAFFGSTDYGPLPANYPPFLDEYCSTGVWSRGGWGSATQIAIKIKGQCNVAAEPSTWGRVKALYGD
jgi:hypothetical protein